MEIDKMAKKKTYEPHRRLSTKVVPSKTDYDRKDTRPTIENEIANTFDTLYHGDSSLIDTKDMEDFGFHITNPLDI